LNTASEFSTKWKLYFNYDKSNVLITGQRTNTYRKWKLCNKYINEVNEYKYLGVNISRNVSDHAHIEEVLKKGNRIIAYIKSIIDNQDDFNRVYYGDLLWKSIGLSSINYACAIWFCNSKTAIGKLENLQYHMARIILKAPRNVAKEALYGDLGWQSIDSTQDNIRVQYFYRLKNMDKDRLPKLLFNAIVYAENKLKWGWLNNIKSSLDKCNMLGFYNKETDSINWSNSFKHVNKRVDQTSWMNRALGKSSLTNYVRHKDQPSLEPYLLDKTNFKGSNLKFKARSNSLGLEGRKAAWSEANMGLCKICNLNESETVDHFMFICTKLADVRSKYFKELEEELCNTGWEIIWYIFMTGDINIRRHLLLDNIFEDNYELGTILDKCCKRFLVEAWKTRNNTMPV
jgi:hypothetical protein